MNTFDRLKHLATLSDASTMAFDITAVEARQLLALTPSSERDEFVDEALDLRTYALSLGFATVEDAREALKLAVEAWVSVKERMPPTGLGVIIEGGLGYFDGQVWRSIGAEHRPIQWDVLYWMRIPRPPAADWARGQKP